MDKLLEFDEKQEEEKVLEPEPRKQAAPEFQEKRRPVQDGFNANEALGLLLNIQRSSDDTKFDLIDGFLDKYKVNQFSVLHLSTVFFQIEKKSRKSADFEDIAAPQTAANRRMTANQIFENIVKSNSTNKVAPFCVQSRGPNPEPAKRVELTPSYSTFEAIQNVEGLCSQLCSQLLFVTYSIIEFSLFPTIYQSLNTSCLIERFKKFVSRHQCRRLIWTI